MSQAAGSTALLILTQVASRALTFMGNQVVLRFSSPALLGIAVQLELVSVTILYFARESLRVALQRHPRTDSSSTNTPKDKHRSSQQLQGAINVSYLAVTLGILLGTASFAYYFNHAPDEVTASPNFSNAVFYYILATLMELLSEPFFIVIQQQGLFRARASAETTAATNRCLIACSVAFYTYRQDESPSVLPFAGGQLAYGVTLFALYYRAAHDASAKGRFSLLPSRLDASPTSPTVMSLLPRPLLSLALTLYAQSTFKLLLTQGDALLLSFLAPLHSQGAFALASNYGGLLARLIFQPIEESSRNTFGALLSSSPTSATTPAPRATHAALTHLSLLLHTYTLLTLPLLTLLPPLLPIISPLALSSQWRTPETTSLLTAYIYYIPLTALNGVLDAFVTSVATPQQLHLQSLSMAAFTGLYSAAAWLFLTKLQLGARGLVWASAVGMVARVAWGAWFAGGWVAEYSRSGNLMGRQGQQQQEQQQQQEHRGEGDDDADTDGKKKGEALRPPYTPGSFARASLPHPTTVLAAGAVCACLQLTLSGQKPGAQQLGEGSAQAEGLDVRHLSFVAMGALVLVVSILAMEMEFLVKVLREALPRRVVERVPGLKGWLDGDGPAAVKEIEVVEEEEEEGAVGKVGVKKDL